LHLTKQNTLHVNWQLFHLSENCFRTSMIYENQIKGNDIIYFNLPCQHVRYSHSTSYQYFRYSMSVLYGTFCLYVVVLVEPGKILIFWHQIIETFYWYSVDNVVMININCTVHVKHHSLSRVVVPATLHSISVNAHFTRYL
jgi:hypothetical protein